MYTESSAVKWFIAESVTYVHPETQLDPSCERSGDFLCAKGSEAALWFHQQESHHG